MPNDALLAEANAVMAASIDAAMGGERLLRVEAPPGAGKTRLIKRLIAASLERDVETCVAVQTNAQLFDLAQGLADELKTGRVGIWPSARARDEYAEEMSALAAHPRIQWVRNKAGASDRNVRVLVAVSAKLAFHASDRKPAVHFDRRFELGVVDEAYQMAAGGLFRFGHLLERLALVGDPGQLEPFTELDTARWTGLAASAVSPGPAAVDALCGETAASFALPASLRLDHRAAAVVQDCFYPRLPSAPSPSTEIAA
jgi:hypothetical protein